MLLGGTTDIASGDYTLQVCMTLAEIAYAEPEYIPAQLAYPYYATEGQFKCLWLGISSGNQMYVCQIPGLDQWVVVVRTFPLPPSLSHVVGRLQRRKTPETAE